MYEWRKMSVEERARVLAERKARGLPWHSPPHLEFRGFLSFIITAACYEHAHLIGKNPERMREFEREILEACQEKDTKIFAWCILPNHYHILVRTGSIGQLRINIGRLHGRTARFWNLEDDQKGRKVWFNYFDRDLRSRRHFWASLNYINHNPVFHGYAQRWQDWAFSSANFYLEKIGYEKARRIWKEFPILDYGKDWDIY